MDLLQRGVTVPHATAASTPMFAPFDTTSELWSDYLARFCTFLGAHSVIDDRKAQVILTNQSPDVYKLLATLACQQAPPKDINGLTMEEITMFMADQFDPRRFTIRERFNYWRDMQRRPGETIQELAVRIRQDAATCNFSAIMDPQDEALRTRFICSVNNEAVLKAFFKVKDDELTFSRAIHIAMETEDANKVAKETVYGARSSQSVHHIRAQGSSRTPSLRISNKSSGPRASNVSSSVNRQSTSSQCYRCGRTGHSANECPFKDAKCHFCDNVGHLKIVCKKKQGLHHVKQLIGVGLVNAVTGLHRSPSPKLDAHVNILGLDYVMELDTATTGNFVSTSFWRKLGKPPLREPKSRYHSATKHSLPILGTFNGRVNQTGSTAGVDVQFIVSTVPNLDLLGRVAIRELVFNAYDGATADMTPVNAVFDHLQPDHILQAACKTMFAEFPDLFNEELGCLKDFELEVNFKPDVQPIFRKPRAVPFAVEEDLARAYNSGVTTGVWKPVQFNDYGTPVVAVRKPLLPGQTTAKLGVCGDYSVKTPSFGSAHGDKSCLCD